MLATAIITSSGEPIYTLAQSETHNSGYSSSNPYISGIGTDIINNPSLINRAKKKVITRKLIRELIDVAKEKGDAEMINSLWNTYYCQSSVIITDNRLFSRYCKNRFCSVCTSIRKAEIINKYYPEISTWEDPHFVTLTVKSCKADKLDRWVWGMKRAFELIHNRCKSRYRRGKGIKIMGIKSLECNFNPKAKTYNPHFHIIVPNKATAQLLKKEWVKQWRPKNKHEYRYKYTNPGAQDIRPVKDLERDLVETIKYGSKIFTDPDMKKRGNRKKPPMIYARAFYNILSAFRHERLFDRFGFNLPTNMPYECNVRMVEEYEEWIFPHSATDWVNPNTGETLTGYITPHELSYLLNERIDTQIK
ncbi:MAG: hypothetical protein C0591_03090 [Marinilabiliales bacterium]|nr:MAG: hypothetical protein C0591_03090 [Marinilabiliales bacterium]